VRPGGRRVADAAAGKAGSGRWKPDDASPRRRESEQAQSAHWFWLCHAEPVALPVGNDCLDAVKLFLGRRPENHSLRLQFLIGSLTIGRMQDAGAHRAFFQQEFECGPYFGVGIHAFVGGEQGNLQVRLFGDNRAERRLRTRRKRGTKL